LLFFTGMGILPPIIGEIEEGSAAEEAGMMVGDKILNINGHEIEVFSDLQRVTRLSEYDKDMDILIDRDGEQVRIQLHPKFMDGYDYPRMGIRAKVNALEKREDIGFFEAFGIATRQAYDMTADTLAYLGQVLFHHRTPREMRGPLGIAEASGDAFEGGPFTLLIFIANISIAVGFMNLLPIPLLDGGHLALYLLEAIRRKPLTEKVQNTVMWVGFSILMGLVGYTFFLDIPRIIQRITG